MEDKPTRVKLTGFDVPLNDVIGLMLKVGVALIPVSIVLGLFYALVFLVLSSLNGCVSFEKRCQEFLDIQRQCNEQYGRAERGVSSKSGTSPRSTGRGQSPKM